MMRAKRATCCLLLPLLLLLLTHCQGQPSGQEKQAVIAGKVPLNRKVQWKFAPCGEIQVNDKKLRLGTTMKEWLATLGPYNRFNQVMNDVYTWDQYGLMAVTRWHKDTVFQMHVVFHYESDRNTNHYHPIEDKIHIQSIREEIAARPKPVFEGGVLLDNVVLGRGMSIKEFNQLSESNNRVFEFSKDIFPHRYSFYPNDCPTPTMYIVELSKDFNDVEQIIVERKSIG